MTRLPTGSEPVDELLGGGVETGALTQVYGEGGSGKTTLAIQFAVETARDGKVVFIDTEGFPAERFRQVAEDPGEVGDRLLIYEPSSMEEQHAAVRAVDRIAEDTDLQAIVIDSVSPFYRVELPDNPDVRRDLASQLTFLTGVAREHGLAVLFTNQVYNDADTGEVRPLGGTMIRHLSKAVLRLEGARDPDRCAVLEKHRSLPAGERRHLLIDRTGIRASPGDEEDLSPGTRGSA